MKRVRGHLAQIDKRSMGKFSLIDGGKVEDAGRGRDGKQEEVMMKATGRAIEKALQLALFFMGQEDCRVVVRTGTVGAVDDIVVMEKEGAEVEEVEQMDAEEAEVPESRVRKASTIEVAVSLK